MNQTSKDPSVRLLQLHLDEAQKALDIDNLAEAKAQFKKALDVPGSHPEREDNIRRALKQYSQNRANEQQPPRWDLVKEAAQVLATLDLQNDETLAWQWQLQFQEAEFRLNQDDNLEASFGIFTDLIDKTEGFPVQSEFKNNISDLVRAYVLQRTSQLQWSVLHQSIKRFKKLRITTDELNDWLEITSQILTATNQIQTKYDEAVDATNQIQTKYGEALNTTEQSKRRYRQYITGLIVAIFIILILAYILPCQC